MEAVAFGKNERQASTGKIMADDRFFAVIPLQQST
jgi:hypothetical protein